MNAVPQSAIAAQPAPSPRVASFLKRAPRLFIGNERVEASSQGRVKVFDPATGREITQVVDANASDVDRAVAAARAAFENGPWADMLPNDRERLRWKLSDLIEKNADELAELESLNNGKTKFMASIIDIPGSRDYFRYMAGWATKIEGATATASWIRTCRSADSSSPASAASMDAG